MKSAWTKAPPDGTGYAYWERPGFYIETKPRFRPACQYELHMAPTRPGEWVDSWPIAFDRLRDAKAAADLPIEALRDMQRASYEAWIRFRAYCRGCAVDLLIHEDALKEDQERRRIAARIAA